MPNRHERLRAARLYLVCDARPDEFLEDVLGAGVDVLQLRMKDAPDAAIVAAGRRFARVAARFDALFILNDRPELVAETGADGVHVGQDDAPVAHARTLVGADRLVGLSTHSPEQVDAAAGVPLDYIGVGPVHETPTKPGRPSTGLPLVSDVAAAGVSRPWFAIGGLSLDRLALVLSAGATRVVVVRAITEADDPGAAAAAFARRLRKL